MYLIKLKSKEILQILWHDDKNKKHNKTLVVNEKI